MTARFVGEPAALVSGPSAYLLSKLLREPPVAAHIRRARWLHGDDFMSAIRAINAASDAWQATAALPQRHNDRRYERPEQHCGTLTVTVEQASEQLDLGKRQVQRLALSGRITGRRVGGRWQLDPASVVAHQHQAPPGKRKA